MAEKEKSNLLVLKPFLLNGEHQPAGRVVAKSAFAVKGDWQNILFMDSPMVEETDAAVGDAAVADAEPAAPAMPGAKKATR